MEVDVPLSNNLMDTEMNHSRIDGKWFREENDSWRGFSLSLEIKEILFQGKSEFQDILIFKSYSFGNVLVLDGIIQCTERDEYTYQEMITHLPMNLHSNPKRVLVIGGGDGGVVREVLKYSSVEEVVLCEIDKMVIDLCKQYLPNMAKCLSNPRVTVNVGDGVDYVGHHPGEFDIIITDAPDPVGPGVVLYQEQFYSKLKAALRTNGVVSCQGQVSFLDMCFVKMMLKGCASVFSNTAYAIGNTPTYAGGNMGYMLASLNPNLKMNEPVRELSDADVSKMELRYYNSDVHRSSFMLPTLIKDAVKNILQR